MSAAPRVRRPARATILGLDGMHGRRAAVVMSRVLGRDEDLRAWILHELELGALSQHARAPAEHDAARVCPRHVSHVELRVVAERGVGADHHAV